MKRIPLKRHTPLRPISKKRSKESRIYAKLRKEFLAREENRFCIIAKEIFHEPFVRTNQIHHKLGRVGKLYLDTKHWMALSPLGHLFVHNNPSEAKARGWLK